MPDTQKTRRDGGHNSLRPIVVIAGDQLVSGKDCHSHPHRRSSRSSHDGLCYPSSPFFCPACLFFFVVWPFPALVCSRFLAWETPFFANIQQITYPKRRLRQNGVKPMPLMSLKTFYPLETAKSCQSPITLGSMVVRHAASHIEFKIRAVIRKLLQQVLVRLAYLVGVFLTRRHDNKPVGSFVLT
jgi:hypothetical protein